MEEIMKLVVNSTLLSLALLIFQAHAMEAPAKAAEVVKEVEVAAKAGAEGFNLGLKVGEFIGSVKAKLPAMPSKEEAKSAVLNAPHAAVAFAKEHPYKTAGILAATAVVAYAVYKVCTAKKAEKTKVVIVKP